MGKKPFEPWASQLPTADILLAMKAAKRVSKPMATRAPQTSSLQPGAVDMALRVKAYSDGKPRIFCVPCIRNRKPAKIRKSAYEGLLRL